MIQEKEIIKRVKLSLKKLRILTIKILQDQLFNEPMLKS
jgi:hypothetical protein